MTFSGPIVKHRLAFTESLEYRYERDQVYTLPPLQNDTRTETFDSYTQLDMNISPKQTAAASFAIFLQKLDYDGLNTFTPQPSTPDLNERGYQAYLQDRYITDSSDLLISQVNFRKLDADLVANSNAPYQLLIETTEGGWSTVRVAIQRASNGLLYLTNKYVVPSRRFNEMYGTVNSSSAACCEMGE